jgi:multidrug transporter EmrE-like cation transporter
MIYLFLNIISSTLIMVVFKIIDTKKTDLFSAIVINYYTAVILGSLTGGVPSGNPAGYSWFVLSLFMGVLFVLVFLIMGLSTKKAGVAITSITGKMSVILPITFSIFWFNEDLSGLKIAGIFLTLLSLFLIVYTPKSIKAEERTSIILPLLLFLGVGTIDSSIKFAQETYIRGIDTNIFSTMTFFAAGVTGTVIWVIRRYFYGIRLPVSVFPGILLGIVNFGSLFFMVKTLDSGIADSSIVFGLTSIGFVGLSIIAGVLFFGEKLTTMKKIGIGFTALSIILLSFS